MTYKIVKKFIESLKGGPVTMFEGPLSPLILQVCWAEDPNPIHLMSLIKDRHTYYLISQKNYFGLAIDKFREYYSEKISLDKLKEDYYAIDKEISELCEEITDKDFKDLRNEEISAYLEKIHKVFVERLAYGTVYIETIDYEKVLSVIGEAKKELLDEIWEKAIHPNFVSFEGRRLKDQIDFVEKDNKNIEKIRYVYTDYYWSETDSEIREKLDLILRNIDENKKKYRIIKEESEKKKADFNEWHSSLSEEKRKITDYVQLMMLFRDIRKDPIGKMQAILCKFSEELLERAGIEKKYARYILIDEYIKGIDYLKSIAKDLKKRSEGCLYLSHPNNEGNEIELCNYEEALKEIKKILPKHLDDEIIKGQIANRGKSKGKVLVVTDPKNDKGFKEGDILVTGMTRPEFVPIMKRAGGVVTNEGGITCHAAIVSRELGIPCVIGTKIATQILKDGMEVEVDANEGIVRIIK